MFRSPRAHETHLFNEIYIDETSQNDHRFLVIGGIMLPLKYSALFERAIFTARSPRLQKRHTNGHLTELGWKYFRPGDLEDYKRIVDVFFAFKGNMESIHDDIRFHCSVVDTQIKGRKYTGGLRGEIGFNREIYYHALRIGRLHESRLFHIYPDFRTTIKPIRELGTILNRGIRKTGDTRDWPFRRIAFRDSKSVQALQVSDIFIGALAYRINRHYDKADANPAKKILADYIMQKAHMLALINSGRLKSKTWGNFQMFVRRHRS
jgi:hypothetical protein